MQPHDPSVSFVARGAVVSPPNRFESTYVEDDWEQLPADELITGQHKVPTEFISDEAKTIICENDSPDIPFRYSINPYRGCEHGCAYCYARPGHELLGMNAGLDFESKIFVKYKAPHLLRCELNRPSWQGDVLALSGVTDCYQPAEHRFRLTRGLLEVMLEACQPTGIVTKNVRVLRDLDLLSPLATKGLVHVFFSITTLNDGLARKLEPRTATPAAKLRAIRELTAAGVPVGVMVAPVIPGLNDHEMPAILEASRNAGAMAADYILLRLPLAVDLVFMQWLSTHFPLARSRVEALIRQTRDGRLNDAKFGRRQSGQGVYAAGLRKTFQLFATKFAMDRRLPPLDCSQFRPPCVPGEQLQLF